MATSRELKSDLFNAQKETVKSEQLSKRFQLKSWCEEYVWLRKGSGFISYIIQILAIAAAFYGAQALAAKGFEDVTIVVAVALIALATMEALQRHSSDKLWDRYWSQHRWSILWLSLSGFLFLVTTAIGSLGTFQSVNDIGEAPTLITNDSLLNDYLAQEATLGREIKQIEKQTDAQGVIFYKIQDRYDAKLAERSDISKKVTSRREWLEENNRLALVRSSQDVERDAWTLVMIFIFLGVLFEASMCFNSYFDFRLECEEHEENPGAFLKELGISELHPTIAKKYPNIAAQLAGSRPIGFQQKPQAPAASGSGVGFMKNYVATKPQTNTAGGATQAPPTPPPPTPATAVDIVATTGSAATKPPVATSRTVEIKGIKDPEDILRELIKKLSPYNANLKNPKRNSENDSRRVREWFAVAEKLDWSLIGDDLKERWAVVKSRIDNNPNFIKQ